MKMHNKYFLAFKHCSHVLYHTHVNKGRVLYSLLTVYKLKGWQGITEILWPLASVMV